MSLGPPGEEEGHRMSLNLPRDMEDARGGLERQKEGKGPSPWESFGLVQKPAVLET